MLEKLLKKNPALALLITSIWFALAIALLVFGKGGLAIGGGAFLLTLYAWALDALSRSGEPPCHK